MNMKITGDVPTDIAHVLGLVAAQTTDAERVAARRSYSVELDLMNRTFTDSCLELDTLKIVDEHRYQVWLAWFALCALQPNGFCTERFWIQTDGTVPVIARIPVNHLPPPSIN